MVRSACLVAAFCFVAACLPSVYAQDKSEVLRMLMERRRIANAVAYSVAGENTMFQGNCTF